MKRMNKVYKQLLMADAFVCHMPIVLPADFGMSCLYL